MCIKEFSKCLYIEKKKKKHKTKKGGKAGSFKEPKALLPPQAAWFRSETCHQLAQTSLPAWLFGFKSCLTPLILKFYKSLLATDT